MTSLARRVRELEQQIADLQDGAYPQASPLGPGRISGAQIKAKSIIGNLLNVSDLESVAANTGTLSVTGTLTAGSGATTMAYDPTNGLYIGAASFASAPFRVNPSGAMTADSATVTGTVSSSNLTATGGTIGTFGITSTDGLAQGTGSSTRGISTGTTTFYAGSATPASAPFNVDRFGNVSMSNATISGSSTFSGALSGATGSFTGALTASSLSLTGTLSFSGSGKINLPGSGQLNSGALDINSATFSGITVDGTITIGTGGKITDADGSYWDQNGIVLKSSGTFGDVITWKVGVTNVGSIFASSTNSTLQVVGGANGAFGGVLTLDTDGPTLGTKDGTQELSLSHSGASYFKNGTDGLTLNTSGNVDLQGSSDVSIILGDIGGTYQFKVKDSSGVQQFGINSNGEWVRPIANDSTALGAYYGRVPIFINGSLKYIPVYS